MEKWIRSLRGVVLDLDGTVYDDGELIDGAGDAIAAVRAAGLGLKFATNTSRYPCGTLIERLRRQGVDAAPDDVFTAPRAAAAWLLDRGITRISLHVSPMTVEEFTRFAIDEQQPEAVVVGDLGDDWTVERLNRVFRHVMGGAQLLAIQKNRYWKHGGTLCLDAGPRSSRPSNTRPPPPRSWRASQARSFLPRRPRPLTSSPPNSSSSVTICKRTCAGPSPWEPERLS